MVHLDGDLVEERVVHTCHIRVDGADSVIIVGQARSLTRMTETCRFDGETYENIYWLDGHGRAVQSIQWVSAEIGHLHITVLRDNDLAILNAGHLCEPAKRQAVGDGACGACAAVYAQCLEFPDDRPPKPKSRIDPAFSAIYTRGN